MHVQSLIHLFVPLFLQVRLQVGLYIVYLLDWMSVYSKEQILVLRLEDHAANCKKTMHKVFRFLSLGKNQTSPFFCMIYKITFTRNALLMLIVLFWLTVLSICVSAHVCKCVYICLYVCKCVCLCICMPAHVCKYVCLCICGGCVTQDPCQWRRRLRSLGVQRPTPGDQLTCTWAPCCLQPGTSSSSFTSPSTRD